MLTGSTRVVGRQTEEARIGAALERVHAGRGTAGVLVTGPGGIGKTALLTCALERLGRDEWRVLASQADTLERDIPYAALARAFAADASRSASQLVATLQTVGAGRRSQARTSFGLICGQATSVLQELAEDHPVALALDDVDALDDDTLELLAVVVRRLGAARLAVLATTRMRSPADTAILTQFLARLEEAPGRLHTIELGPLPQDSTAPILAPLLGAPPDEALQRDVHARAGGVPFYVLEIAAAMQRTGCIAIADGRARLTVPASEIRLTGLEALLRRVVPLRLEPRRVLDALAVAGHSDPQLLAQVTGLAPDEVDEALDVLEGEGVLVAANGIYRFAHDLVRDAAYDSIGHARRGRLHRRIAALLQAHRADGRTIDALTLARHVSECAEEGDPTAAGILAHAADLTRRAAPHAAVGLYARALEVLGPGAADRGVLQARLARALLLSARPGEAIAVGAEALSALEPGPERRSTAGAVINSLIELGRLDEALGLVDAEAAVAPSPVVHANRARVLWNLKRFPEALDEACRAEAMPASSAVERLLTLAPLNVMSACTGRPVPIAQLTAEMLRLGAALEPTFDLLATATASYALATSGYPALALESLQRAEPLVERLGGRAFRDSVLVARAFVDWQQGRWDAADHLDSVVAELAGAGFAVAASAVRGVEIELLWQRGLPIDEELLNAPAPAPNVADLKAWAVAGAQAAAGELAAARALLAGALAHGDLGVGYRHPLLARLTEVELAAGDDVAAAAALRALEEATASVRHPWGVTLLLRSHAAIAGDIEAAREAVREAVAAGNKIEAVTAQVVLARLDPRGGDELVELYRAVDAMGAERLRRQAAELLRARGLQVPASARAAPGLLGAGELRVARLVQRGLRNREIATELHYSPRTVEHYVSRIFDKLGVRSRVELARRLDAVIGPAE